MQFVAIWTMLALSGSDGSTVHQHGVDLYKKHEYAGAVSALQESSKEEKAGSPEFQESALLIGQSYFMLSLAPKAIPWLERVRTVNEANYMLGYAYLQTHQQDESRAAFARLFKADPNSASGHLLAGQMMLKKEYEDEASIEINKAIDLDPKIPQAHFLLGEIEIYRGKLDEAIASLTTELSLNSAYSMAWYRRGDAYTRQEKWGLAIPDLQRAIWLNPDFSGPFVLLGKCYFKTNDFPNAEGILRRALGLDPNNASATYVLGQTLMLEGKSDEGRTFLEKWKTLRPPRQLLGPSPQQ